MNRGSVIFSGFNTFSFHLRLTWTPYILMRKDRGEFWNKHKYGLFCESSKTLAVTFDVEPA